ncbi:MAG: hypothetical protein P8163_12205 [Candidatus Thiodiazotropha sp.]
MPMQRLLSLLLTALTAGLAGAIVVLFLMPERLSAPQPASPPAAVTANQPSNQLPRQPGPFSYADAVDRAAPSVVNIFSTKITTESQAMRFKDPVLQHLFGSILPEKTRQRLDTSLGSGVIVSEGSH